MGKDFVEDLTADEQKKADKRLKDEARDGLIRHVFDNLRNLSLCIWLILAGGAVIKYNKVLYFPELTNVIIGLLIIVAALGLGGWNMMHGVEKIIRPIVGTRKAFIAVPFAMMYFITVITIIQALMMLYAEKQLH